MSGPTADNDRMNHGDGRTRRALLGMVTAGAVTALSGCLVSGDVERETTTEQYTISGDRVDRIAVSADDGDTAVRRASGTDVRIEATKFARGKTDLSDVRITRDVFDGRLDVGVDVASQVGIGAFGGGVEELAVRVPRGVDVERIDVDDGHVAVSGVSGDLELTVDDGSADVGPLNGHLSVSVDDGDISTGEVDSVAGEFNDGRLTMVEPAAVGDIIGDDAEFELAISRTDGDAVIRCDDGRIDAQLADTLDATVVVEGAGNDVTVHSGVFESVETTDGTTRGRLGDGRHQLTLDAEDSDVQVRPA